MPYEVSTPVFEGPFDLLLHLVTVDQVDLYEVSMSRIVDAYLAEMARMEDQLDLEVATEFVLIAAILIELKCRRLLPGPADVDGDEEVALWEERDLLLGRLLECKTFKDAGAILGRLAEAAAASPPRAAGLEDRFAKLAPDLLAHITADRLGRAMTRLGVPPSQPRVDLSHLAPISLSVADTVVRLSQILPARGRVPFRKLTGGLDGGLEVIVYFLAILELYKDGLVELEQAERFGALLVTWAGGDGWAAGSTLVAAGLPRED